MNTITYVKPKNNTIKVPQTINVYFLICLCIFGFDFGLKKTLSKHFRVLLTCVQLCVSFIMCVLLNYRISSLGSDYFLALLFTFQYLTHHTLLLFSKYSVYDLIIDVHTLDKNIMEAVNTKFAFVLYFYTILTFGLKQTLCVINCFVGARYCESPFPGYWYCVPLIGLDGVTIIQMLLYYHVYRSVKYIKLSLVNFDITTVQKRYCVVVNYCEKIRPLNSAFVSVLVFCCKTDDV